VLLSTIHYAAGRIYVLYNMNLDNITVYPNGKPITRSDELGFFVFRYSDDGGVTWSRDRGIVPIRFTSIDANNTWLGKVRIFWNVDQVKQDPTGTRVSFAFTKIGVCKSILCCVIAHRASSTNAFVVQIPKMRLKSSGYFPAPTC
jgi:hypothetical protein